MNNILNDTASFLVNNGIAGGSTDWNIFEEYLPNKPDKAVVINSTGGLSQEVNFDLSYPSIQIRIRGKRGLQGQRDARAKAKEIKNIMHTGNFTMGTIGYAYCLAEGDILSLGRDQNNRQQYSLNFQTARNKK